MVFIDIEGGILNSKAIDFIKNFSYTLSSNSVSMIISILVTLIVPKLIGIEEYGFWQLYLLYSTYVGFLHFGWNDGIYLRYGGEKYKDLDKRLFFSQFYMLVILQVIIVFIIFFVSDIYVINENKLFIFKMTAFCTIIVNLRYMLLYILQGTNRIKVYASITMLDRMIYLLLIVFFLLGGNRHYKLMILADILGKLFSLIYAMYTCKDIVFNNIFEFYFDFKESFENVRIGIKLMFANIASMLIIGVVRFGIERFWSVETFGKVSLTLSISNFLMIFINSIGIVIFPVLRRTSEEKLVNIYSSIRDFLMVILFGILIIYYPFKSMLSDWLPAYAESLKYMAILFPMCVYEGKMSLLINTYLKTLREEKLILKVNSIVLSISIIVTIITTYFLENLDLTVFSIVVLLAFRCVIAETYLSRIMNISVSKDIFLELFMTTVFIISGWYVNSGLTIVIYGITYLLYLFIKKNDIKRTIRGIRDLYLK